MKFVPLYKGITLTVQEKYIKCTRPSFVKDFNWFWIIPLFFLSSKGHTPMSCTLFNFHMKIPIFSSIMIFGEIFFYTNCIREMCQVYNGVQDS